jgi:hypothetical protein
MRNKSLLCLISSNSIPVVMEQALSVSSSLVLIFYVVVLHIFSLMWLHSNLKIIYFGLDVESGFIVDVS